MGDIEFKTGTEVVFPDIQDIRNLARNLVQGFFGDPRSADFGGRKEEEEEIQGAIGRKVNVITDVIGSDDSVVAVNNGRIIGSLGFVELAKMPNGRPIFELTAGTVLPEYQKQGIYPKMYKMIEEKIMAKNPNAVIIAFSRHPDVIEMKKRRGFKIHTVEEYAKLGKKSFSPELLERLKRDEYVVLIRDPLNESVL